jgi:hypothetical protein
LGIRDRYCEGADEARENPEAKPAPERSDPTDDRESGASGGGEKEKLRESGEASEAQQGPAIQARPAATSQSERLRHFLNPSRNGREELMSARGRRADRKSGQRHEILRSRNEFCKQ